MFNEKLYLRISVLENRIIFSKSALFFLSTIYKSSAIVGRDTANIATHQTELHQSTYAYIRQVSHAFIKALMNSFAHQTPTRSAIRIRQLV